MGELFREFMNLFRGDESPFLKLAKLIAVLTVVVGIVIALESAMGLVTIGRLERKVNLLKELNALTETGMGNQGKLQSLFQGAVSDLEQYNPDLRHMMSSIFPDDYQPTFSEVSAGASIWLLIGLAMLKTTKGGLATKLSGSGLVMAVGLAMGFFSDFIIETQSPIVTIGLNFLCGSIPLILLGIVLMRRSRKETQPVNAAASDNPET